MATTPIRIARMNFGDFKTEISDLKAKPPSLWIDKARIHQQEFSIVLLAMPILVEGAS